MSLSEQNTIRILLVDDHKSFSEGLAMVINSRKPAMEVVAMASTREEALDAVVKYKPDLAILDIERVDAGEIWASNTTLSRVLSQLSNGKQNNGPADPEQQKIAELTPREREIITTLLSFESSTNEEIADHLCISQSTLKNHLTTIFSKLEVKNRIQLMKYAINHKLAKPI
jgi:DNA-binding NarL/FixJ family response regulator